MQLNFLPAPFPDVKGVLAEAAAAFFSFLPSSAPEIPAEALFLFFPPSLFFLARCFLGLVVATRPSVDASMVVTLVVVGVVVAGNTVVGVSVMGVNCSWLAL